MPKQNTRNNLPTVVNITGGKKLHQDYDVYIGRHNTYRRLPPSPFSNPFVVGRHGDRDQVLQKYRTYIYNRLLAEPELRRQLEELRGKRLGCWCHPKPCHGDILIEWLRMHATAPSPTLLPAHRQSKLPMLQEQKEQ